MYIFMEEGERVVCACTRAGVGMGVSVQSNLPCVDAVFANTGEGKGYHNLEMGGEGWGGVGLEDIGNHRKFFCKGNKEL